MAKPDTDDDALPDPGCDAKTSRENPGDRTGEKVAKAFAKAFAISDEEKQSLINGLRNVGGKPVDDEYCTCDDTCPEHCYCSCHDIDHLEEDIRNA